MKAMKYCTFGLMMACVAGFPIWNSSAESGTSCQDLIQECFAAANSERGTCFEGASKHPTCQNSELGALAAKRAQFSATNPTKNEEGPAFLGPQIINSRCVTNFDHAWSASLINGTPSKEELSMLTATLQGCADDTTPELPHP